MAWISWAVALAVVLATVALQPVAAKIRRRGQKPRPEGLLVLSDPPNAKLEIVAVHGLAAHAEFTWMCENKALAQPKKVHLLRNLIKDDFPDARILSFAHNSDWLIDAPVKTAQQIGDRLLRQLAQHRSSRSSVPIIFIGHSFGGIVIKEALCKLGADAREVVDSTCAIIFLGTPHLGSPVSHAGSLVAYLTRFLGSDAGLLLALTRHQKQLSDLEDRFIDCMRQKETRRQKTGIVSFCETKPTYLGWLSLGIIVPRDSARGHAETAIAIDTDHSGLNKCCGRDSQLYCELLEQLRRLKPTTAPSLNRNQQFVVERLGTVEGAAFDSHVNEHDPLCLPGTRWEVLQEINKWADDSTCERICWLHGKAGTGKSTIARTVARNLATCDRLAASFSFKRGEGDRGTARRFVTAIAAQLVQRLPAVAEHVRNAREADPDVASKALGHQFEKLILQPMQLAYCDPPVAMTVVIDALDECDGDEDIKAIIYLLSRANCLIKVKASLRFFVTSRFEPPIRLGFDNINGKYEKLLLDEIPKPEIERDIAAFLKVQLEQIRGQFRMASDWPSQSQFQRLLNMAIPLFIFAATSCRFIGDDRQGGGDPDDRLKQILEYQAYGDFDATYLPALNQMIFGLKGPRRDQAIQEFKYIVGSIAALANPLPATSLAHLLGLTAASVNNRLQRLHSVLDIPADADAPVRLFHESFRNFLIHPDQKDEHQFWVDESETHKVLAERCFRLLSEGNRLKEDICGMQMPGTLRKDIDKRKIDTCLPPEVQYACLHWVHHLKRGGVGLNDGHQALQFLRHHVLHWLEALSLIGKILESIGLIDELQSLVDTDNSAKLWRFLQDTRRFILYHRSAINQTPLQLYSSALIFSPERSIIRQTFQDLVSWITTKPNTGRNWSPCLQNFEGHSAWVTSVAFSADGGPQLASGSIDTTVKIWDTATGALQHTLEGHGGFINSVAFSADGRQLVSGSQDTKIWDTATGMLQRTLEGHGDSINSVAFSTGGRLASGSADRTIKVWDPATGALQHTLEGHGSSINSVAFSADGRLASASSDTTVKIWDSVTGALQRTLEGHSKEVISVTFSNDGRQLASGSEDNTIKIWDTATGMLQRTLEGHSGWVSAVAFSPNGRKLVSGWEDNTITIWDTATGAIQHTLEGHSRSINSVAFSADGRQLASTSGDTNTITIWDTETGTLQCTLEGHSGWVSAVAFSPNGRKLASGSEDNTITIWDTATGAIQHTLEGHSRSINSVAFSADGRQLVSGSDDKTVRVWDTATGALYRTVKGYNYKNFNVTLDSTGSVVFTERKALKTPRFHGCSLSPDESWIQWNGHDALWLPPDYRRSAHFAVAISPSGLTIALGCQSGRVLVIGFSASGPPQSHRI